MIPSLSDSRHESGFTLVELLVSIAIALIILAGLVMNFSSQSNEYSYQNRRIDAVQDMEFAIKFIAEDLRSALVSTTTPISITNDAQGYTTDFKFRVWDQDLDSWGKSSDSIATKKSMAQAENYRALRHYTYDPASQDLNYDRNAVNVPNGDNPSSILSNVTYFRVFEDSPGVIPAGFLNAPAGLPKRLVNDPDGKATQVSGYTILIEIAVQAGYKEGRFQDVKGNTTTDKRVWRYVQVHPMSVVQ
jgi:prepilin-type N-terminal cleavage/methylation domain-containing protein